MTVKTPEAVGFLMKMNALAPLLRDYIQKTFEITDSEAGVLGLLYRLRFTGTRPPWRRPTRNNQQPFGPISKSLKKLLHGESQYPDILIEPVSIVIGVLNFDGRVATATWLETKPYTKEKVLKRAMIVRRVLGLSLHGS